MIYIIIGFGLGCISMLFLGIYLTLRQREIALENQTMQVIVFHNTTMFTMRDKKSKELIHSQSFLNDNVSIEFKRGTEGKSWSYL